MAYASNLQDFLRVFIESVKVAPAPRGKFFNPERLTVIWRRREEAGLTEWRRRPLRPSIERGREKR